MKNLFILILLTCAAYGIQFLSTFSDPEKISPASICADVPSGTRIPNDTDCNRFTLCDNGYSMSLSCRSTDPHFNRCTSTCVNDVTVCTISSCSEDTTTTTEATTSTAEETTTEEQTTTTEETTTTTTESTTELETTTTEATTTTSTSSTTTFIPPTVPVVIPCTDNDINDNGCDDYVEGTCDCEEQWGCWRGVCGCNVATQCHFADTDCVANCGCAGNCDCVNSLCVCYDTCKCIEPPLVCPFLRSQCAEMCGCATRCVCNGDDFCTCDTAVSC